MGVGEGSNHHGGRSSPDIFVQPTAHRSAWTRQHKEQTEGKPTRGAGWAPTPLLELTRPALIQHCLPGIGPERLLLTTGRPSIIRPDLHQVVEECRRRAEVGEPAAGRRVAVDAV